MELDCIAMVHSPGVGGVGWTDRDRGCHGHSQKHLLLTVLNFHPTYRSAKSTLHLNHFGHWVQMFWAHFIAPSAGAAINTCDSFSPFYMPQECWFSLCSSSLASFLQLGPLMRDRHIEQLPC
jgi:hypothetical protein